MGARLRHGASARRFCSARRRGGGVAGRRLFVCDAAVGRLGPFDLGGRRFDGDGRPLRRAVDGDRRRAIARTGRRIEGGLAAFRFADVCAAVDRLVRLSAGDVQIGERIPAHHFRRDCGGVVRAATHAAVGAVGGRRARRRDLRRGERRACDQHRPVRQQEQLRPGGRDDVADRLGGGGRSAPAGRIPSCSAPSP